MEDQERLLKIYKYGDDVLRLKANNITDFNGKIIGLIERMTHTLHHTHNAVGLAAPQIGESVQLSVIDLSQGHNPDDLLLLLNPEIIEEEGKEPGEEGCLSFPGISLNINRATRIFLKSFDLNGKEIRQEIDGFLARVIQHEIDHLNGTLIIDRISSLKRQMVKRDIKRLQNDGEW